MPRLLVMRGDALEQEIDLRGRTVRIGRGATNDLVLEDPGKSVSRNHAEVRYQGGRYVLVDLQSQNGVWVSGSRLPQVVLEPNIVATIGPFRLLLETSGDSVANPDAEVQPTGETIYPDEEQPAARSRGADPRAQSGTRGVPAGAQSWLTQYRMPLLGGVAALALGGGAWAVLGSRSGASTEDYVARLHEAEDRIANGDCTSALSEIINPALEQAPGNAEAIRLAEDAKSCGDQPPAPTPPAGAPPPASIAVRLQDAASALSARSCAEAQQIIESVLLGDPGNQRALELRQEASTCVPEATTTAAVPRPTPSLVGGGPAKLLTPEQGGLPTFPSETNDSYQGRIRSIQGRFHEADTTLASQDLRRALTLFEAVAKDATPGYRDHGDPNDSVSDRIRTIRLRIKDQGRKLLDSANAFESRGEFNRAIEEYRRAAQMDADLNVTADVERVTTAKTVEGERLCEQARNPYAFGRFDEAAPLYRRALELLPASHPCYAIANERRGAAGR